MSGPLFQWLLFAHVLDAISFFLFHGASAAMAFKLRSESEFNRIRALLDLSQTTFVGMGISFVVMGLSGLAMPFVIHIWDKVYIWLSIGLMIGVVIYMGVSSEQLYKRLRRLVGLPYMIGGKSFPAEAPASPDEVRALLQTSSLGGLVVSGYVVPAFVLWMMIFKPF